MQHFFRVALECLHGLGEEERGTEKMKERNEGNEGSLACAHPRVGKILIRYVL